MNRKTLKEIQKYTESFRKDYVEKKGIIQILWRNVRMSVPLIAPLIPFNGFNTIKRELRKEKGSVLDVGGGWGSLMLSVSNPNLFPKINIDVTNEHLEFSKKIHSHDEYILGDIREINFKDKSFDITICVGVIEHLTKEEGLELLQKLCKITRKKIIIDAPVNEPISEERKLLAKGRKGDLGHISSWSPEEFKKFGYIVRGEYFPLKLIKGKIITHSSNKLLSLFGYFLYFIVSPYVYFFPKFSGYMICIKKI